MESSSADLKMKLFVTINQQIMVWWRFSERNTTIAVAKIDAKVLEDMQGTSIDQMLQGRLAG